MSDDIKKLVDATEKDFKAQSSPTGEQNNVPDLPEELLPFVNPTLKNSMAPAVPQGVPPELAPFAAPRVDNSAVRPEPNQLPEGIPEELLEFTKPIEAVDPEAGFLDTAAGALKRGAVDIAGTPALLKGIYSEATGDLEGANQAFDEYQALQAMAPKAVVPGIENIASVKDAGLWFTERLGEQAANLLTLATGAGATALTANLVGKGLVKSAAKRAALTKFGANVGGAATGMGLETGGTGAELKEATGSFQPETALTAGAIKGALEWYTPYKIAKRWGDGSTSIANAIVKGVGTEALTEGLQETTDAIARAYEDQSYQFFSRSTGMRILNSMAAGAVVGGTISGGAKAAERLVGPAKERTLSESDIAKIISQPEVDFDNEDTWDNPLTWLRKKFVRKPDNTDDLNTKIRESKTEDYAEISSMLSGIRRTWEGKELDDMQLEKVRDFEDAITPRYMVKSPTGSFSSILNDTDTEVELTKFSQDQKAEVFKVDLQQLNAGHITAEVSDLPAPNDSRIFFMPWVKPEDRVALSEQYAEVYKQFERIGDIRLTGDSTSIQMSESMLRDIYKPLIDKGLRVIPSRGSSFIYSGEVPGTQVSDFRANRFKPVTMRMVNGSEVFEELSSKVNTSIGFTKSDVGIDRKPITIDLNKYEIEDGIAMPYANVKSEELAKLDQLSDYVFKKGLTQEEKIALFNEFKGKIIQEDLFEYWRKGIAYNPASLNKLPIEVVFQAFRKISKDKLVPGIATPMWEKRGPFTRWPTSNGDRGQIAIYQGDVSEYTLDEIKGLEKAASYLKTLRENLSELAKKYNFNDKWHLQIILGKTDGLNPAYYSPNGNVIHIEIGRILTETAGGVYPPLSAMLDTNIPTFLHSVLLHEYGHLVAYETWDKLPSYIQERIFAAYEKTLLSARLNNETFSTGFPGKGISEAADPVYYLTFEEYMAEQFRRWGSSDTNARTRIEKHFKEGSFKFTEFFKLYAETLDERTARDMVYSSWEFSSMMEYLQEAANPGTQEMNLVERAMSLPAEISTGGIGLHRALEETQLAVDEFFKLLRQNTSINLSAKIASEDGSVTYGTYSPGSNLIRLMVGSIGLQKSGYARKVFVHEAAHAVWDLLTPQEKQILVSAAKRAKVFTGENAARYREKMRAIATDRGWEKAYTDQQIENIINEEHYAALVASRLNGKSYTSEINRILDLISQLIEKVVNKLRGLGYVSADDLISAFYRGEIARRDDSAALEGIFLNSIKASSIKLRGQGVYKFKYKGGLASNDKLNAKVIPLNREMADLRVGASRGKYFEVDKIEYLADRNIYVGVQYIGADKKAVIFKFYQPGDGPLVGDLKSQLDQLGREIGSVDLISRGPLGYEVENVEVHRDFRLQGFAKEFYKYIQSDLNISEMKPSGVLIPEGYQMWKKRDPLKVQWHVYDSVSDSWLSPNKINSSYQRWKIISQNAKAQKSAVDPALIQATLVKYKNLRARINPKAYEDPLLETYFMKDRDPRLTIIKNEHYLSEVKRGEDVSESKLVKAITDETIGSLESNYAQSFRKKAEKSQEANAKVLGVDINLGAPRQPETEGIHAAVQFMRRGEKDPKVNRVLSGISAEADRISWFSKMFFSIKQVAWKNPQNPQLRGYTAAVEAMNNFRMMMITKADTTSRKWNDLATDQRESLADYLFWLTEMNYRSPIEVQNNVVRQPTMAEIGNAQRQFRLNQDTVILADEIRQQFDEFLTETEKVSADLITRTYANNPVGLQAAMAKLTADMAAMRQKPYFPMTRFGKWHITARDGSGKVVFFAAYPTQRERDRALRQVAIQYRGNDFSIGLIPEEAHEFMGLPGPLIDRLLDPASGLPGLSNQQQQWLQQFRILNAPENSFRKRWLERKGTPGYSLDAFRVYAHYFLSGSNYLAKLKYRNEIYQHVVDLRSTLPKLRDSRKRVHLVDMLQKHYDYIMEGGKDFGKLKSLISLWQLGFSPAAAAMNLMQTPTVTYPYFAKLFGDGRALGALTKSVNAQKRASSQGGINALQFEAARELLKSMGKLDVGQAAELGAYAEGNNLLSMAAGTDLQKHWRTFSHMGMWMFGKMESMNREIAFATAWELVLSNVNGSHYTEIEQLNLPEISRILNTPITVNGQQVTLTYDQAVAVVAAREAIDRTQFMFQPWARPKFLQNRYASIFMVFFGYIQAMVYAFGNNPGAIRMVLVYAFLFGLMGLPGAEDADELLKMITRLGHKYFGAQFSIEQEVREFVNSLTKDTIFEKTGTDLMLRGVSRFSFGPGLIQEGYGIPQFDASANGSLGKLVPGMAELMRGIGAGAKWQDITGQMAKESAGAGLGLLFPLLQFLGSDSFTADQKKWELVMPRAAKAASKSFRYFNEGKEVSRNGADLAHFDIKDPDDLATIVAQGLGFTPTVVSKEFEAKRVFQDEVQWLTARRLAIMEQFNYALRMQDQKAIGEVRERLLKFNQDMRERGIPSMSITANGLKSSLGNRARGRAMESQGLPKIKSQIPLMDQVREELHAPGPNPPGSPRVVDERTVK